jgi:hypothetical protein
MKMLPRGVSDHCPLRIDFGGKAQFKESLFRFEKWWLEMDDFREIVKKVWDSECPVSDPVGI